MRYSGHFLAKTVALPSRIGSDSSGSRPTSCATSRACLEEAISYSCVLGASTSKDENGVEVQEEPSQPVGAS
jgi:hypothetical protein